MDYRSKGEFSISEDSIKFCLSPTMNLFDNSFIEYKLAFKKKNHSVFNMLDKVIEEYLDAKSIFYSDRGFRYTESTLKTRLKKLV